MAPNVHHDWPTFENHTYKRHATRNTLTMTHTTSTHLLTAGAMLDRRSAKVMSSNLYIKKILKIKLKFLNLENSVQVLVGFIKVSLLQFLFQRRPKDSNTGEYFTDWSGNLISYHYPSLPSPFFFILHFCCPLCPSSTIFLFPLLPEGSVGHTVCPSLSLHVSLPPFFHPLSQSNKLVKSFIFFPSSVDTLLGSLSREHYYIAAFSMDICWSFSFTMIIFHPTHLSLFVWNDECTS